MAKKFVLLMFLLGFTARNTVQMNKFNQPVEPPNLSA